MEKKNRGTYKVNENLTPKENVVALLKMTFPMETTLAKMQNTLDVEKDEWYAWRSINNAMKLNEVRIYPANKYRWDSCTEIKSFQRVVFTAKTPTTVSYRRNILRSVPVVNKKISLTKVTRILTEFAKYNEQYTDEQEKARIERERQEELRKVQEKQLEDIRHIAKLPKRASIERTNFWSTDCKTFDINIDELSETEALAVAKGIKEALASVRNAKKATTPEGE